MEGETYYATLLSATDSTGPWSYRSEVYDGQEVMWTAFHNYQDIDGFISSATMRTAESQTFMGLLSAQTFKLLLYFPNYDRMIVSENIYGVPLTAFALTPGLGYSNTSVAAQRLCR